MTEISENAGEIAARKGDHIRLSLDAGSQGPTDAFSGYQLPYMALPEMNLSDVDTSTDVLSKKLAAPLIIASMTGGSEHGRLINTNLAIAAEQCGIAMGLGSQRIGLEQKDAESTFRLTREHAPNAFLIANMGAVQFNYGHSVDSYRRVVDMIQANALYLHLNPLQEALQPGGDTNFAGLLKHIAELVKVLDVPVFVKEVGHGVSGIVAKQLFDVGVTGVDVAGTGGTSYAWIEAKRKKNDDFADWFKNYGLPTDQAVVECAEAKHLNRGQIVIASGGIRNPIDGLIARTLGADLFSAAVPFLESAMQPTPDALIEKVENWKQGLRVAMFASGVKNWDEAKNLPVIRK